MLYWLIKQPPAPGEEHVASPPKVSKVSKAKQIPSQKAAAKLVDNQSATRPWHPIVIWM